MVAHSITCLLPHPAWLLPSLLIELLGLEPCLKSCFWVIIVAERMEDNLLCDSAGRCTCAQPSVGGAVPGNLKSAAS